METRSRLRWATIGIAALVVVALIGGALWWRSRRTETFPSVTALVAAMRSGGVDCVGLKLQPVPSLSDFGSCHIDTDPAHEIDIYMYEDAAERERGYAGATQLHPLVVLQSANWYMTTGTVHNAEQIRSVIGGDVSP